MCDAFDAQLLSFEPRFGNERLARVLFQLELPLGHPDPERLAMYNLSAAMGPRWAEICNEFTERIRPLGPSPIRLAIQAQERR